MLSGGCSDQSVGCSLCESGLLMAIYNRERRKCNKCRGAMPTVPFPIKFNYAPEGDFCALSLLLLFRSRSERGVKISFLRPQPSITEHVFKEKEF